MGRAACPGPGGPEALVVGLREVQVLMPSHVTVPKWLLHQGKESSRNARFAQGGYQPSLVTKPSAVGTMTGGSYPSLSGPWIVFALLSRIKALPAPTYLSCDFSPE